MDIAKLETKSHAEQGAALHLCHPALGHHLYTGDGADEHGRLIDSDTAHPCKVILRGGESETVRRKAKQLQASAKGKNADDEKAGLDFVCSLVIGFEGLEKDGKPLTAADAREFFRQSDGLVEQALTFSTDRANFFTEA